MKKCVFKKNASCAVLVNGKCKKCSFCKTERQLEEGRRKAKERIRTLTKEEQEYIDEKYYSDKKGLRAEFSKVGFECIF